MLVLPIRVQNFNNFVKTQNSITTTKSEGNNNNIKLMSYPKNYYLSFCGKKMSNAELTERIGLENFPSPKIAENFLANPDKSLYEVHKEYYAHLLDCETLEEAKKLYPEFSDVVDAVEYVNKNKIHKNNTLYKISQGEIKGADIEKLSFDLLKNYYGEAKELANKENYYGLSKHAIFDLFKQLNIPRFSDKYSPILIRSNPVIEEKRNQAKIKYNASKEGQETIKRTVQKQIATIHSPEGQKRQEQKVIKQKLWWKSPEGQMQAEANGRRINSLKENEDFQVAQTQGIIKQKAWWQTSQGRAQCLENQQRLENFNQTEKMDRIRDLSALSCSLSWYFNTENRNIMSEISKEYFDFVELLNKKKNGTLSDTENIVLLSYFKNCNDAMPEHHKDIGSVHSLMYKELNARIQKVENKTATDDDLTILSSYYLLTKAQAPEYLDCFSDVEDTLLENEDTFSEAVNMMSDYYKNIQEKYPKEIVDKYFFRLKEVLDEEINRNCD